MNNWPFLLSGGLLVALMLALLQGCIGGYNRPMRLIQDIGPVYPTAARAAGTEGWVKLRYDVTIDGLVENVTLLESSPLGVFDAAALAAVAQWRYQPAIIDGAASAVTGVVSTLRFELGAAERYQGY